MVDARGRVLALRRQGVKERAWQMPQRGIEDDQTPRQAALRELQEERGLSVRDVDLAAEHPDWVVYELPHEFRRPKVGWGQAPKWFLLRAREGATVMPDGREFDVFAWLPSAELLARVIALRRPVYGEVFRKLLGATVANTSG